MKRLVGIIAGTLLGIGLIGEPIASALAKTQAEIVSAVSVETVGLAGVWQGTLLAGGVSLRLIIEIKKEGSGYTGTLTSIDQSPQKFPLSAVTLSQNKLHLEVKVIGGEFNGELNDSAASAEGKWEQGGNSLALTLKRDSKIPVVRRPQEPKRPYPYDEQEVAYDNTIDHVRLAATLTLPRGKGPWPAVVLITGSGPQNRDEELLGHKPFLILSDYLTRRGIAVLRADDRGIGKSTGNFGSATTADFANDTEAGVAYLKTRPAIDHAHIGLIGHSEGGVIAPMVAARSKDVAFIVLMAGTGMIGEEILYAQSALIGKAGGETEAQIVEQKSLQKQMFAIAKQDIDAETKQKKLQALVKEALDKLPESEKKSVGDLDQFAKTQSGAVSGPWFRYFLSYDPAIALRKVACPVLAINGSNDLQVPPKQNLPTIAAALKAGGNIDYTIKELPGLNHLFQTSTTGAPSEYSQIEETIAPIALQTMGDWILKHTKLKTP